MTDATLSFSVLTGGRAPALAAASSGPDLGEAGYSETEYQVSGIATSYTAPELPADGRYELSESIEAAFTTRIVVRRPTDPARFNGAVVVEWLNVSSGQDAAPDYTYLSAELLRGGYAWAGVSAQMIGVEGGHATVAIDNHTGSGLKQVDAERYWALDHPGDAFCYDIFSRIGAALGAGTADDPLAGLHVERRLGIGESQSAFALSTYVNGVAPLRGVFDGYLIHSRGGAVAPLGEVGAGVNLAVAKSGVPTRIRDDVKVPVIVVQTETDLFGDLAYLPARQPDSDLFRLWEIAGTAHADKFQIGEFESFLSCPEPVNRGQQVYVLRAALRHLDTWSRGGTPAPTAERLATRGDGDTTEFVLDVHGNVEGGVRTPAVDAPVSVLSGFTDPGASRICRLFGSTIPLDEGRLRQLYASSADYLDCYRRAVDTAISEGFVLAEDREALLAEAEPDLVPE